MKGQNFDSLAFGVIDFNSGENEFLEYRQEQIYVNESKMIFDLASLTKPLTLGLSYLVKPEIYTKEMLLLLEHRSGLPSWGRLSHDNWKEQILDYKIQEKDTEYSDFGALRLMLEIENKIGKPIKDILSPYWLDGLKFWKDLSPEGNYPITGQRNGHDICGEVHDDNAFVIGEFCTHAGLFSDIFSLIKNLLAMEERFSFLDKISQEVSENRFCLGWDTAKDQEKSLAGKGFSEGTFGHLGFTGTSIWLDPIKKRGYLLLTNATQNSWYDKAQLNKLRKSLGSIVWSS